MPGPTIYAPAISPFYVNKFGYSENITTARSYVSDLGADQEFLSVATSLKITSSDAADTSAGTGARTVQVQGLDENWDLASETVTLNGQTTVYTANTYLRIFRMKCMSWGDDGENQGTVYAGNGTVTDGVPANKYAAVTALENQTLMSIWTVPRGYTARLHNCRVTGDSSKTIKIWMRAKDNVNSPGGWQTKEKHSMFAGFITWVCDPRAVYTEKTDIAFLGSVSTGTTEIGAAFDVSYWEDT